MRIEAAAQAQGVPIIWKPFLLGSIFRDLGMETSPFNRQKEKGAHMWQDMVRECRKYGLRWTKPSKFPRLSVLPARVALLGADQKWIAAFCRQVMEANFVHDEDINRSDRLAPILTALGVPAVDILREAEAEGTKARLREQTALARARGVFGAPTFFVGTEMFWGKDRLDDAVIGGYSECVMERRRRRRNWLGYSQTPACSAAASSSSSGPTTSTGRWPAANTVRQGKSSVGFSA
jgi:2-hydroxychromene-2-carboxylate isomerase